MEEFVMLEAGDRVLVCLSGGKDSLSLLHTLHQYQFYARKKVGYIGVSCLHGVLLYLKKQRVKPFRY